MIDAVIAHYPATASFLVGGHSMLLRQFVALLQSRYDLYLNVVAARQALFMAVRDKDAAMAAAKIDYANAVTAIRADKGADSNLLGHFGIADPKPRRPLTTTERVIAVSKRAQTRKVRGTLGKRQREAIVAEGRPGVAVITTEGQQVVVTPFVPAIQPESTQPAAVNPEASHTVPASGTGTAGNPSNGATGTSGSGAKR